MQRFCFGTVAHIYKFAGEEVIVREFGQIYSHVKSLRSFCPNHYQILTSCDIWLINVLRANASKVLLITTNIKTQRKISISGLIYFPRLKAMPAAGYANAKIFVNKQGLMRLFLSLFSID